jgi:hypothetical protein
MRWKEKWTKGMAQGQVHTTYGLAFNFANAGVMEENVATPQMSIHQGLKIFGEAGVQAVKKELLQVHD